MSAIIPSENISQVNYTLLVYIQAHQLAMIDFMLHDHATRTGEDMQQLRDKFQNCVEHRYKEVNDSMFEDYGALNLDDVLPPGTTGSH